MKNLKNNQKGQALIFVIGTMTIAMAVGVGVAVRNLSSISRSSRTDTSTRAQAAAEGGVENFLAKPNSELESLVNTTQTITFTPTGEDSITTVADVTVEYYNIPSGQSYLPLTISGGKMAQVWLNDSLNEVCWSSTNESVSSDLYFSAYNDSGDIVREGVSASTSLGSPPEYSTNFETSNAGNTVFDDCFSPTLPDNATILRIRSLNAGSRVGVYPGGVSLPNQGYRITSDGKLQGTSQDDNIDDVEARVVVTKSFDYMPGVFDFNIYSGATGAPLD